MRYTDLPSVTAAKHILCLVNQEVESQQMTTSHARTPSYVHGVCQGLRTLVHFRKEDNSCGGLRYHFTQRLF